jgi:hypothetical protein
VNAGSWTAGAFNDPEVMYQAQIDGMLAEITDCIFFRNLHADAYTEAEARGVLDASNNNVVVVKDVSEYNPADPNAGMPIADLKRGDLETKGGKNMLPVTYINPRAATLDSIFSANMAPDDGFFTPAPYRGGFDPYENWLVGWTAAYEYGMTD